MSTAEATGQLRQVIAATGPILLDFDGPVTHLFIDGRNQRLADQLRAILVTGGVTPPDEIASSKDPLAVLRWSAAHTDSVTAAAVEAACIDGEFQCTHESSITPGAKELLHASQEAHRPVVIVSNNAAGPIKAFLQAHQLGHLVQGVIGRAPGHPERMKPHPDAVNRALELLGTPPARCVLIGDSVTDIEVAHFVGTRSIGYAKNPKRGRELTAAGADALAEHIEEIAKIVVRQ